MGMLADYAREALLRAIEGDMTMDNPWSTRVKCQGPGCTNEANVERPGDVGSGWFLLRVPILIKGGHGPNYQILPFCGLTCLYNWTKARIPSKRNKD